MRLAYVKFNEIKYENYDFIGSSFGYFIEPAVCLRIGGPNFKFQAQFGIAKKLSIEQFVMYEPMSTSAGFLIRVDKLF